jgi:hypothetical protein
MTGYYDNSHKDFPKSGETLGQTPSSAAHKIFLGITIILFPAGRCPQIEKAGI